MTDQFVKKIVLEELGWEPSVDAAHIGVTARDGVVTLSGYVGSYAEKLAAEQSAGRVSGVKGIADEIEVRYATPVEDGDEGIAKRALLVLSWDNAVPKEQVKVKVDKGWVTLEGVLEWYFQKSSAEADIRKLHGVTGVTNGITLKPSIQPSDVRARIQGALERNAQIESSDIKVTADGGKVTLKGTVSSYVERRLAERTAWSTSGVTAVDDRMTFA